MCIRDRVVISSWSPNRISRFEWGIISPLFEDLMVPNLNQPADIDFDTVHDCICIPSGGNDQVILFDLADCATAVPGTPGSEDFSVSLTADGRSLWFQGLPPDVTTYRVLDATGRLLGMGRPQASVALPAGIGVIIVLVDGLGARRLVVP